MLYALAIIVVGLLSSSDGCWMKHNNSRITYLCTKSVEAMHPEADCTVGLDSTEYATMRYLRYECPSVLNKNQIIPDDIKRFSNLHTVDLSHGRLSTMIKLPFGDSVQVIDISNNYLETIPSDAFANTKNVTSINLSSNAISDLNDSVTNLQSLEELDLSGNLFTQFNYGSFGTNINLKHLYLRDNPIQIFKFNLFSATQTVAVYFPSNIIRDLFVSCTTSICPFGSFKDADYFSNIRDFKATGNQLQANDISRMLLQFGAKLEKLELSQNNIESLDGCIAGLQNKENLTHLDLTHNPLKAFNFNESLPSVRSNVDVLLPTATIEKLDVSCTTNCKFVGFDLGDVFKNLRTLNASGRQNESTDIILGKIGPQIEILDLSWNLMNRINSTVFRHYGNLKKLTWTHANLSYIHKNAFNFQTQLVKLDLSYNNLRTIEFARRMPVKELYLQNNALENINGITRAKFPNLTTLSIIGNKLQCDYLRKYRESLNSTDPIYNIVPQSISIACK